MTIRSKAALALLLLFSIAGRLSADDRVFHPRHVAKLKSVTSATISPRGKQVAYTLAVQRNPLDGDNGSAYSELHVTDVQGKSRPFITGKVNVSSVQWTRDGRTIAFLDRRGDDEHTSLYTIPIDGGEARRLLTHDASVHDVQFSADGKQIAFLATEPIAKQAQEYRDKGFNQELYEEDDLPTKVWISAADGSGKPRALELTGSASSVRWNPSGRQLAVVLAPTPLVDDSYMFKRISIVDVDSGKVVERIENAGKLGQIDFSGDGKHLAMISGVDIHDPKDGRLMVVALPGNGKPRDLMPQYEAHVTSFRWKDDRTLLWAAGEGTATTVGTVDLDGQRKVILSGDKPIVGLISLAGDGRTMATVGHTATHPGEVFLLSDGKAARRLTDSNPWLAKMRFARQEVVRHKARDGLELEGVLIYPLNYEEGRRYPLILAVHGGPESHVSNGWITRYSRPGQFAASRGFAVFYPNYRGSTGRGVAFSKLGQADAAGKEFDDLVDAVDHLAAIGLVDKQKAGITGGSYGGYASAWGATYYSDRFAAAVMFVGISDNMSKVGTTDIPEEMYLVHHRKRLWEDWDYFRDRSPIRYVQRNRTPTLIMHGKADPRVHPSQSMELYRHLKTLDQAPVRLVFYPGEGHGNRRAAARFDYSLRLMRWMERYLQGPGGDAPVGQFDYAKEYGEE
ncbi:MAG: S9 family peptidase [Candidatus Nealsonbacteria bacterium]|nr:S9 family peptidase [Candidatus Nealsonbacteria bacterium]